MTMTSSDLQSKAEKFAGNWQQSGNFSWFEQPDNAETWGLYHTEHRDSTLLEQSNAAAIKREFSHMIGRGNVRQEHFTHWACGWIDALAVRVYDKRGKVTRAFERLSDLMERMEGYPVLDEDDYSRREYEATLENIADCARCYCGTSLTDEQVRAVYHWFSENNDSALEASDDTGAYPEESDMHEALTALGLLQAVD